MFLAALAALYLTLVTESVSQWVTHCHFRMLTQRVTFDTSDPSDIWSEWCQDKKTKRQKRKRQKDKKTKRQKEKKTEKQKDKKTKNKDQQENLILRRQGSFALLRCFLPWWHVVFGWAPKIRESPNIFKKYKYNRYHHQHKFQCNHSGVKYKCNDLEEQPNLLVTVEERVE